MAKTKKRQPCKTVRVNTCTGTAQDGFKTCRACRAAGKVYRDRYRRKHPEAVKATNRRHFMKHYVCSQTPKAVAYRARHRLTKVAATRAWTARNAERKALLGRLAEAVKQGEIVKPTHCQDCRKAKSPIVGWGIGEDADGLRVERWVCWSDWWSRKRAEEGRE